MVCGDDSPAMRFNVNECSINRIVSAISECMQPRFQRASEDGRAGASRTGVPLAPLPVWCEVRRYPALLLPCTCCWSDFVNEDLLRSVSLARTQNK